MSPPSYPPHTSAPVESDELAQRLLAGHAWGELCWFRPEFRSEAEILDGWRGALAQRGTPGHPATLHVYVHVPFCVKRCRFCWYWSNALRSAEQLPSYVASLEGFLTRFRGRVGPLRATNIYCGGGTPSILPASLLDRLLASLTADGAPTHQFCVEANPTSLDEEKIALMGRYGVNRVSLGVQSFEDDILRSIGRQGVPTPRLGQLITALQARDVLTNLDLQLSLPGQSAEAVRRDLRLAFNLGPDVITLYRYQTNPGLPTRQEPPLRFSQVVNTSLMAAALRRGFVYAVQPGGDEGFSVTFRRVGRRTGDQVLRQLKHAATDRLGGQSPVPIYKCFDDRYAHLLGLGPGAFSHLYGCGWYRDVTSFERQARGQSPVYCGSPLTPLETGRLEVLDALARRVAVRPARLAQILDRKTAEQLQQELTAGASSGHLRQALGRFTWRSQVDAESREHFLRRLLPALKVPSLGVPGHAERIHPARRSRLEGLLSSARRLGIRLDEDVHVSIIDVLQRYFQESWSLRRWVALLEIPTPGEVFLNAKVALHDLDAVYFQIEPAPALPLGVAVKTAKESADACHASTRRFALILVPRPAALLTTAEQAWLKGLVDRTRKREGGDALWPANGAGMTS